MANRSVLCQLAAADDCVRSYAPLTAPPAYTRPQIGNRPPGDSEGGTPLKTDPPGFIAMIDKKCYHSSMPGKHSSLSPIRRALSPRPLDDDKIVDLWLHGRSEHTRRAYGADVRRFRAFMAKPLNHATLAELQAFSDSLGSPKPSRASAGKTRALAAVKSLLAFAHRSGLVRVNVGAALRLPKRHTTVGERILSESQVQRMLALETDARGQALLRLLYGGGLRISEACGLRWRDLQEDGDGGIVQVQGKGEKHRAVRLSKATWASVTRLRMDNAKLDSAVLRGRSENHLSVPQAYRLVRRAAQRAGIERPISPHFLRHSHASHALDHGCPIHVVQVTLGHASVATTGVYLHVRPGESSGKYIPA